MSRQALKLEEPVVIGEQGQPITELSFRTKIVAGDLRGIKLATFGDLLVEDLLKIAGRLAGQPDVVMTALSFGDFSRVVETVGGFFDPKPGPQTGPTSTP